MLSEYKYEYDGQDNVISETINGVVNSYDYNESDELKASTKTIDGKTVITEYSYDLFGNKVESSSDGTNKIYRYNDKNQLTSIKSKDGLTDIYYDKNGNVRDIYYAGGYKEYYQYDEFGQLTALKTNRDRTYNYEYDGEGDRIHEEKIINSPYDLDYKQDTEEWFDYMQSLPFTEVEELLDAKKSDESFDAMRYQLTYRRKNGLCASNLIKDPKSNEKCEYKDYLLDKTAENTLVLSENDDVHIYGEERISTENADGTQTYLSGNNQSVMAEISSKGTMSQIEYDDFGKTDDKTSGYGYNGEKLDTTGNIYLRARYYNPRIGQFVQIDDYKGTQDNITSQNRYTYCLNNQYKYVDPSGNDFVLGIAIIGSIMILGSYVLGSLATPALRKANKNLTNVVSNALEKGKKATNNLKNTIAKKINSKKVIQTVTKAIAPAIPVGIKVLKSTLTIPQPCPTSVGFDQLPKELLPTIHGLAGASAFVNEYLSKLYRVKKREKKEKHHIVAKKAWDECGRVKHDFYLNKPRTAISHNLGSLDVEPNYAYISNTLHRYIHTRLYYGSIYINFQGLVEENEKNKRTILIRLGMYRKILEGLSDFANKIK